jgi:hypothetical protein
MITLPPIRNATLTAVAGAGSSDDYDATGDVGLTKWAGAERVFWSEDAGRDANGTEVNVIVGRSMVVEAGLPVAWKIGDVVTVHRDGYQTQTATVRHVATTTNPLFPGVTRLIMENA